MNMHESKQKCTETVSKANLEFGVLCYAFNLSQNAFS
jgi:hypothetical protein